MREMPTYILANRLYKLKSSDPKLLDLLDSLLPKFHDRFTDLPVATIDLDGPLTIRGLDETLWAQDNPGAALVSILDKALADHEGTIWIDASALITPSGQLVLISGPSHSGKTTLGLSMALAHDWKIVAEDIVLIDLKTSQIPAFCRPLSLRSDTKDKIKQATGLDTGQLFNGWTFSQNYYCLDSQAANFSLAVDLEVTAPDSTSNLKHRTVTTNEFLRRLITHSNALRFDNGIDKLASYIPESCHVLSGGTLADRIKVLLDLSC